MEMESDDVGHRFPLAPTFSISSANTCSLSPSTNVVYFLWEFRLRHRGMAWWPLAQRYRSRMNSNKAITFKG